MMEQEKSKAFQEILSALQKGQNLDALLAQYPHWVDELRPLLELSQAIPQARPNRSEVTAMRQRLDARFEAELADFTIAKRPPRRPLLALVASLTLLILGLWVFFPRGIELTADEIHLTQGTVPATATATVTASPTMTASPTVSPSATATSSPSPTMRRPSITPAPSSTATDSPSQSSTAASCRPRADWEIYELESGDTLSEIAFNVGLTLAELMAANCIDNPRGLLVGQEIYVPYLWEDEADEEDDASGEEDSDDGSEDDGDASGEDNSDDGSEDDDDASDEEDSDDGSEDDDLPDEEDDSSSDDD